MSGRYSGFGNPEQEMHVRAMENSWKTIDQDSLPEYCRLTAENLSREMSDYYRKYIERLPQWT